MNISWQVLFGFLEVLFGFWVSCPSLCHIILHYQCSAQIVENVTQRLVKKWKRTSQISYQRN